MSSFLKPKMPVIAAIAIVIIVAVLITVRIMFPATPEPGELFTATVVKVEPATYKFYGDTYDDGTWLYMKHGMKTLKLYTTASGFGSEFVGSVFRIAYQKELKPDREHGSQVKVMQIESGKLFQGLIKDNRPKDKQGAQGYPINSEP